MMLQPSPQEPSSGLWCFRWFYLSAFPLCVSCVYLSAFRSLCVCVLCAVCVPKYVPSVCVVCVPQHIPSQSVCAVCIPQCVPFVCAVCDLSCMLPSTPGGFCPSKELPIVLKPTCTQCISYGRAILGLRVHCTDESPIGRNSHI